VILEMIALTWGNWNPTGCSRKAEHLQAYRIAMREKSCNVRGIAQIMRQLDALFVRNGEEKKDSPFLTTPFLTGEL
jgi:hypothetical protein